MEDGGTVSVMVPSWELICNSTAKSSLLSIITTVDVDGAGVVKPMNWREDLPLAVTSILCEPGGTNLLKWPKW